MDRFNLNQTKAIYQIEVQAQSKFEFSLGWDYVSFNFIGFSNEQMKIEKQKMNANKWNQSAMTNF